MQDNDIERLARDFGFLSPTDSELALVKHAVRLAEARARLDEARWWIQQLKENGDEIMEFEFERIADLQRAGEQVQKEQGK